MNNNYVLSETSFKSFLKDSDRISKKVFSEKEFDYDKVYDNNYIEIAKRFIYDGNTRFNVFVLANGTSDVRIYSNEDFEKDGETLYQYIDIKGVQTIDFDKDGCVYFYENEDKLIYKINDYNHYRIPWKVLNFEIPPLEIIQQEDFQKYEFLHEEDLKLGNLSKGELIFLINFLLYKADYSKTDYDTIIENISDGFSDDCNIYDMENGKIYSAVDTTGRFIEDEELKEIDDYTSLISEVFESESDELEMETEDEDDWINILNKQKSRTHYSSMNSSELQLSKLSGWNKTLLMNVFLCQLDCSHKEYNAFIKSMEEKKYNFHFNGYHTYALVDEDVDYDDNGYWFFGTKAIKILNMSENRQALIINYILHELDYSKERYNQLVKDVLNEFERAFEKLFSEIYTDDHQWENVISAVSRDEITMNLSGAEKIRKISSSMWRDIFSEEISLIKQIQ